MPTLPAPAEIYEWRDGETKAFTILSYEVGDQEIHPRDGRPAKTISTLRIHVPPEEKPTFPPYWDFTSQRLVAQLQTILPPGIVIPFKVSITAVGAAPATHFSVTRVPERPT